MATTHTSENAAAESGRRLARRNHTVRSSAFAYAFLVLALLGWERHMGPGYWAALGLSFLVYPHLVYWHALRARDPRQAEIRSLFVDAALFGVWTAALHFPSWVAYAALSGVTLNAVLARGLPGALASLALFMAGALAWVALYGFQRYPLTGDVVVGLCFLGSLGYTLAVGFGVHARTRRQPRSGS